MTLRERIDAAIATFDDPIMRKAGAEAAASVVPSFPIVVTMSAGAWVIESNTNAALMVKQIEEALASVPEEFRSETIIETDGEEYSRTLEMTYRRPETEDEAIARWQRATANIAERALREYRMFQSLRQTYEPLAAAMAGRPEPPAPTRPHFGGRPRILKR